MAERKRQRRNGGDRSERQGFTAFNMDDENEEGHFDEDGNFIWKKEEKSVQEEAWLDGVSEEQIEAAKSAKDRKDYRDEQEDERMTEEQANAKLAELLRPRETVLQALQRLGKKRPKARAGANKRKHVSNGQAPPDAQTPEEKQQFERITEAADFLMRMGEVDVYSQMKEEFIPEEELLAQRQHQREQQERAEREEQQAQRASYFGQQAAVAQQAPAPAKEEVMWEYKGADGEIHGPYPTSTLLAWRQQGYFVGGNAVDMRVVPKAGESSAESKQEEKEEEKPKLSAEEELMNDFEDSDEEEEKKAQEPATNAANEWKRSDEIDFASYQS